jgi:hypothetical protein
MNDNINEWVGRARANENESAESQPKSVKVIRKESVPSRGQLIMQIADKLLPHLTQWFHGKYNDEGMLIQNSHVRGFAIDMAEGLVKKHYHNDNAASA